MKSVVSYPDRGSYGNNKYSGNLPADFNWKGHIGMFFYAVFA